MPNLNKRILPLVFASAALTASSCQCGVPKIQNDNRYSR